MDTGKWNQQIGTAGALVDTSIDGWAAKQLTIVNLGPEKLFAKVNATVPAVTAAVAAGEGAVPIGPGSAMTWKASRIASVALATASGTTTIDWAAVKESAADPVRVPV